MKFILLAFFIGSAMAGGYHTPIVASIHHKTIPVARPVAIHQTHNVVKTNAHTVVDAVHHPPVSHLAQAPTTVLAKAPRIHGFRFQSEVQHNAPAAYGHAGAAIAHSGVAVAHGPAVAVSHGAGYGNGGVVGVKNIIGHAPAAITPAGAGPVVTRTSGFVGKSGGHTRYGAAPSVAVPIGGYGHSGVIGHAGILGGYGYGLGYGHDGYGVSVQKVGVAAGPQHITEPLRISSYGIETGRVLQDSQVTYGTAHIPAVQKIAVKQPDVAVHHPPRVVGHSAHVVGHSAHVVGHNNHVVGKVATPIGYVHGYH